MAKSERTIRTKITLEGDAEYKKSLKSINEEAKLHESALKRLDAEYATEKNSIEYLEQKQSALTEALATNTQKIQTMEAALENAQRQQKDYAQNAENARQRIAELSEQMSKLDTSTEDGAEAYSKLSAELEDLNAEVKTNEAGADKASKAVMNWSTQANKAYTTQANLKQQLAETADALRATDSATEQAEGGVEDFSASADDAAQSTRELGDGAERSAEQVDGLSAKTVAVGALMANAVEAAAEKMKELASAMVETAMEYDEAQSLLASATGATGEELESLESVARNVFAGAFGESLTDAYNGVIAVRNATGLMDEALQKATENGFALQEVFGFDLQESARTVASLMTNFGISADEAYNIIAVGAQNGANKNGDLLDVLNEYSAQYAALGLSSDEFIQSLVSGADKGVFSIDKVGDAVKEFNIQAKDGADANKQAFETLGMSADDMIARFAAGGESARTAFYQVVDALDALDDPVQKNAVAVELFGTQYEDLEANLIPILSSMRDASVNTYDAMEQINEVRMDKLTSAWEQVKRKVVSGVLPKLQRGIDQVGTVMSSSKIDGEAEEIAENLALVADAGADLASEVLPALADVLSVVMEFMPVIVENIPAVVAGILAYNAAGLVQSAVTTAATIAQEGLNAAIMANPYALAAAAVVALGTVLIDKLIDPLGKTQDEIYETSDSLNAISHRAEEAQSAFTGSIGSIAGQEERLLGLVGRMDELSQQTSLTAGEQAEMYGIVEQLNAAIPDLGLAYDGASNSINMTAEAILALIDAEMRQQQFEAAKERTTKLIEEQAKAYDALEEAKANQAEAQDAYDKALEDYNEHQNDAVGVVTEYKDALNNAEIELEDANEDVDEAQKLYDSLSGQVDDAASEMAGMANASNEATAAEKEAAAAAEEAAKKNEEYAQAISDMEEVLQEAGIYVEGLAQQLVDQGITADDAASKIEEYKDRTLNAFDEISVDQAVTVQGMIDTLRHNTEVTQQWSANLAYLYANASDSATREFLDYMEGLGPEYSGILNELVNDTSGSLMSELVAAWSAGSTASVEAALLALGVLPEEAAAIAAQATAATSTEMSADTSAYMQAGEEASQAFSEGLASIGEASSEVLEAMNATIAEKLDEIAANMQSKGKTVGTNLTTGMRNGINGGKAAVTTAASGVASGAYSSISARPWYNLGYNLSSGVASGIYGGGSLISRAINSVINQALASARKNNDINSPSGRWRDELGVFLPQGAAVGVDEDTDVLLAAVDRSMRAALETGRETIQAMGGIGLYDLIPDLGEFGGGTTINNYSNVSTVSSSTGGESGDESATGYLRDIRDALRGTGGVTAPMIARAISPYIDNELGAVARRKERYR